MPPFDVIENEAGTFAPSFDHAIASVGFCAAFDDTWMRPLVGVADAVTVAVRVGDAVDVAVAVLVRVGVEV